MEKNIKMSLETAREMYKNLRCGKTAKEELEGNEGYTWEDAFNEEGWFISSNSIVMRGGGLTKNPMNKNTFKTEAQAKSALAFAQLTHIVSKYNEGKENLSVCYSIKKNSNRGLRIGCSNYNEEHLEFFDIKDAKTSLRVNRELWEQYHMIEK